MTNITEVVEIIKSCREASEKRWKEAIEADDDGRGFEADIKGCLAAYDAALDCLAEGREGALGDARNHIERADQLEGGTGDHQEAERALAAIDGLLYPDDPDERVFRVSTYYRQSGNWLETGEPPAKFDSLPEAIAAAEACENGDYGEGEFIAMVWDDDGDCAYSHEWDVDPHQDRIDDADWLVTFEDEFSTTLYGVDGEGIYVTTTQNGGSRGAHSRQEGDGRWSTLADPVEEIELPELVDAMLKDGQTLIGALEAIPGYTDDLLLELLDNQRDWTDAELEEVLAWVEATDPTHIDRIKEEIADLRKKEDAA